MKNDDDQMISRHLDSLARHAPRYRDLPRSTPAAGRHRYLVPILASACVIAIALGFGALMTRGDPEGATATASDSSAASPADPPAVTKGGLPMRLEAAAGWSHLQVRDCGVWSPTGANAVVQLESLDDGCIAKAPSSATTVLVAPYEGSGLFGSPWDEVTTPWRTIDGHQVSRLSSGPLMEMSSRVADAIVCPSCDQVIVVLGPDPSAVRALVESATG